MQDGRDSEGRPRYKDVPRHRTDSIWCQEYVLVSTETVLENGENEYPFSVTIPEDAQSSLMQGFGGFAKYEGRTMKHGTINTAIIFNKFNL